VCYLADGVGLRKINAAFTHSAVAGPPALAQIAVYNQRLFGITGTDQTIDYSDLNNGDTCGVASATSGSAIVRTFGSQKLTALCVLKNSLAMFHVSGISRFTGLTQDDIAIGAGSEGLSVDTGTIAPRSIVPVEGVAYFLSERGAFRLTDSGVEALDLPTRPDCVRPQTLSVPASVLAAATGSHDRARNCIRWSITGNVISYNYRLGIWVGRDFANAFNSVTAQFDGIDADGKPIILTGTQSGVVYHVCDESFYLDDLLPNDTGGTPFEMVVSTRPFWGPTPGTQKSWSTAYLFGNFIEAYTGTVDATLTYDTNLVQGAITGIEAPSYGLTGASHIIDVPFSALGHWLVLTFSDTSDTDVRIKRIEVEAFDYGRRRP
jgi:hypothetical protein